mmetsp:Transcript_40500/g.114718  ORF Transcript_40500/g.114718 Transcript_40500/m.114718 type:complete len:245 (+) Transcript_40500:1744-2478(+)
MGVVHLTAGLAWKILEVGMALLEASKDILQRSSHKEVLLLKTEGLALCSVVIRVQHGTDCLCLLLLENSVDVSSGVEGLKVKLIHRLGLPKAEVHGVVGLETWNRGIIGKSNDLFPGGPLAVLDLAKETHFELDVVAGDVPWVASCQPHIGDFLLVPFRIANLLEHAIAIADSIPPTRQAEGSNGVQKAGCKTPQASVSKGSITLLLHQLLKIVAKRTEGLSKLIFESQVVHSVEERPSHQELR